MKFKKLLQIIADEPVFETGLLLAGKENPDDIRRQLSRWVKAGKLYQLRRGVYAPAPPYRKKVPHPFVVANKLAAASYVSLQSALAFYGLIPEYTPVTTSITGGRPVVRRTPLGNYIFRHIQSGLFWGYTQQEVAPDQHAFVATPEKSLLDLIYLTPGADNPAYLAELRLQNLTLLNLNKLAQMAAQSNSAKLQRAANIIIDLAADEQSTYEEL